MKDCCDLCAILYSTLILSHFHDLHNPRSTDPADYNKRYRRRNRSYRRKDVAWQHYSASSFFMCISNNDNYIVRLSFMTCKCKISSLPVQPGLKVDCPIYLIHSQRVVRFPTDHRCVSDDLDPSDQKKKGVVCSSLSWPAYPSYSNPHDF